MRATHDMEAVAKRGARDDARVATRMTNLCEFENLDRLHQASANWIAERLADAITRRGQANLLLSGGSTPAPTYAALSKIELDWRAVKAGLTDERWVERGHPSSNAGMVHRVLLQNAARDLLFVPMKQPGDDPFAAVASTNEAYAFARCCDVMVLGMGPDAHTLSWFPGARGLAAAIAPDTPHAVAALEAKPSAVTGPNLLRMSLTLPCVARARHVLLLITGREKRGVLETASAETPVGLMIRHAGQALTIHYTD